MFHTDGNLIVAVRKFVKTPKIEDCAECETFTAVLRILISELCCCVSGSVVQDVSRDRSALICKAEAEYLWA